MSKLPRYISKSKKRNNLQQLINEALYILDKLGIPLEGISLRCRERIGMAFLAVSNVKQSKVFSPLFSERFYIIFRLLITKKYDFTKTAQRMAI
ncbi:MAG: hypothetical protein IGS23_09960 [Rivularia sp. T60_A2020_040]|nr:hypothetical protein [Rivularia sp. T60_A2020_040]